MQKITSSSFPSVFLQSLPPPLPLEVPVNDTKHLSQYLLSWSLTLFLQRSFQARSCELDFPSSIFSLDLTAIDWALAGIPKAICCLAPPRLGPDIGTPLDTQLLIVLHHQDTGCNPVTRGIALRFAFSCLLAKRCKLVRIGIWLRSFLCLIAQLKLHTLRPYLFSSQKP